MPPPGPAPSLAAGHPAGVASGSHASSWFPCWERVRPALAAFVASPGPPLRDLPCPARRRAALPAPSPMHRRISARPGRATQSSLGPKRRRDPGMAAERPPCRCRQGSDGAPGRAGGRSDEAFRQGGSAARHGHGARRRRAGGAAPAAGGDGVRPGPSRQEGAAGPQAARRSRRPGGERRENGRYPCSFHGETGGCGRRAADAITLRPARGTARRHEEAPDGPAPPPTPLSEPGERIAGRPWSRARSGRGRS
ncbi:hypothetical protein BMIN10S_02620 [Bosea minatitlanensis]